MFACPVWARACIDVGRGVGLTPHTWLPTAVRELRSTPAILDYVQSRYMMSSAKLTAVGGISRCTTEVESGNHNMISAAVATRQRTELLIDCEDHHDTGFPQTWRAHCQSLVASAS